MVADTGIGISEEEQSALFKPFSQLKSGQQQGGTGLGLAISYRLVKAMGGALEVTSRPGLGSCFSFSIPYRLPEGSESSAWSVQHPESMVPLPSNRKRRILVVDDSTNNREMLVNVLRSMQFRVDSAADGMEAVEKCKTSRYNLVLMDLKMPKMDGLEATRAIHLLPGQQSLKVVAVSASVSDATREGIAGYGIRDFIAKPVCFSELLAKIYRTLAIDLEAEQKQTGAFFLSDLPVDPDSARTMALVVKQCLEIGDIELLAREAGLWQKQPDFGDYPEQLVRLCTELDLRSIEIMREELLGVAEGKS